MKRIAGVDFYWGKTKYMKLSFPTFNRSWEASMYGVGIKSCFFGLLVRGKRIQNNG